MSNYIYIFELILNINYYYTYLQLINESINKIKYKMTNFSKLIGRNF